MSKWRADMATSRRQRADECDSNGHVAIVQLDLDAEAVDLAVDAAATRAWVEAFRHGNVVGRAEVTANGGVIDAAQLSGLAATFADDGVRALDHVADHDLPFASVVVPTICRDPDLLARTVQSLLDLDYPRFEVLVVDNTATGADLPTLSDRVRVCREPLPGVSRARNRGLCVAEGSIVAFTDDDAVVDRRWLRAFGARFVTEPEVVAIGGLVLPHELATEPQLWFEEFYGGFSQSYAPRSWSVSRAPDDDPLFPYAAGRFGAGCNMAFRTEALVRSGGFDDSLGAGTPARGGEDLYSFVSFLTSGATVGFEPAALVRHTHRRSRAAFFRQVFDYGVGLTAMYAALVAREPRHGWQMVRRIPAALRLLLRPRDVRSVSRSPSYPRRTIVVQLLGMFVGPFAFLRSRRWAASHP